MGRNKIVGEDSKELIAFRIKKTNSELIKEIAKKNGITVTEVINTCLTEPLSVYDLIKVYPIPEKEIIF